MIEKKLYVCEKCNTSYNEKRKAEECESSHKTIKSVVDARYQSITSNATGIPTKVCIRFTDNTEAWYHR